MTERRFLTIGGFAPTKPSKRGLVETREEHEARLDALEAEAAKPTGFDILQEQKEEGLGKMQKLLKDEPSLSRKQLSARLNLSMRTVYRYLRIIRVGQNITQTIVDREVEDKKKRVIMVKQLIETHPEYSRVQLAEKVGVSRKTLYSYLDELGR